jgi:hypothetical protein
LSGWSSDADAFAVLLDATELDVDDAGHVARQLPDPAALPGGAAVFVLGTALRAGGWRAFFGPRRVPVSREVRSAALLSRGYVDIGALRDRESGADLVYGSAPPAVDAIS